MKFIRAHFGNNERTAVKAYYADDKGNEIPYVISAEDGNPQWKKLLKHITIDELHESTHEYIRRSREDYKNEVVEIAKRDGLIYDGDYINTDVYKMFVKTIFDTELKEKEVKEQLFMFKLALFELNKIKESDNREMKAALRKAETLPAALKIACDLFED